MFSSVTHQKLSKVLLQLTPQYSELLHSHKPFVYKIIDVTYQSSHEINWMLIVIVLYILDHMSASDKKTT